MSSPGFKTINELMRSHDKKIGEVAAINQSKKEKEYLKKNPKANTKYMKYITRFQDQVDYFG